MTMGVFDFKAIKRKLECQDQKAEFEEKNPKPVEAAPVVWTPDWGYGAAVPFDPDVVYVLAPSAVNAAARKYMAEAAKPLTSLAHPEWPYTGTPHEWPKFKNLTNG